MAVRETLDLFGEEEPASGRRATTSAERQAAYRARHGVPVQVLLEPEVKAELDAYMRRQSVDGPGRTLSQVVTRLLRQQLFRRR